MPEDDPREPRFDTTPAPRLGPADPLRGRREAPEEPLAEEAAESHPALTIRMVVAGIIGATILTSGIVYAVRHSAAPNPPPPVAVAQVTAPQSAPTVTPAETPPPPPAPVTPPPAAPPPAVSVAPPPKPTAPSPIPAAPPPAPHPAHPPHQDKPPAAAVPSSGPKHRRRSAEETGDWLVQVGAYRTQDHAELIVDTLTKHGWKPHTVKGKEGWILVEITGYRTHDDAATAAGQLAAKEHVPTLVRRVIPKSASADH